MSGIIPKGTIGVGFQLPIQSLSATFAQDWEHSAGPAELADIAIAADRAGFFYVAVCDHVATPSTSEIGATWYDTIATLAWLGAQTERVHVLSHVYVLPYRHPLVAAKAWSTLDLLTGGRAILGVGAGHLEAEFASLDVPFADRGAALDESITAVKAAFDSESASFAGERWSFSDMRVGPRSPRAGGPPIWVGGSSKRAIERAATLGDGWLPQGPPKMGTRAALAYIRELREAAGLADVGFDMGVNCEPCYIGAPSHEVPSWTAVGSGEEVAARLRRYVDLGMNQLQLRFDGRSADELFDQLGLFGEHVLPLRTPS